MPDYLGGPILQRCPKVWKEQRRRCGHYKGHKGDHRFGVKFLKRNWGYVHD